MQLTLCVNTPDKDTKQMSLVSGSVTADGTAKFECTVDAPESKSLTIAGVQASYEFKESYGLLGIIGLPKTIKGNGSSTLCTFVTDLTVAIPSSDIYLYGVPIVPNILTNNVDGNRIVIDTNGVVKVQFYATTNNQLLVFPPIRYRIADFD